MYHYHIIHLTNYTWNQPPQMEGHGFETVAFYVGRLAICYGGRQCVLLFPKNDD